MKDNKSLQQQVQMSNVSAVREAKEDARQARRRATIAEKARDQAQEEAVQAAETAKWKIKEAKDDADKKYREMVGDYCGKHLLITVYCLIVTVMQFVMSERCRADSAAFFGGIWNIIKAVTGWEEDLFTLGVGGIIGGIVCMIGIPIGLIFLVIHMTAFYRKVCMKQNISEASEDETQQATFRTEMVALITAVVPLYLVEILPEGWNYWGIFLTGQLIYFVHCWYHEDDEHNR